MSNVVVVNHLSLDGIMQAPVDPRRLRTAERALTNEGGNTP